MKKLNSLTAIIASFYFLIPVFAETVVLKSGKTVEGKILEKTDKHLKIEISGVGITYYLDEIESIDGQKTLASSETIAPSSKNSAASSQISDASEESFADKVIGKLKSADFESLFKDFYIPKNYDARAIQDDKEAITAGLSELIQNKLGALENYSRVSVVTEQLMTLDLSTGTPEIAARLVSRNFFYKVVFSKFGAAYINVGISDDNGKTVVKNIIVGLPISDSKSKGVALDFLKFMSDIAEKQQKRDPAPVQK
ncbi:MAG: hypothetical protein PHV55_01315 [Candidatus Omnitrophica bacterium]|nr:hypothetical protein [Candidatus Omnitrophota bacterium]